LEQTVALRAPAAQRQSSALLEDLHIVVAQPEQLLVSDHEVFHVRLSSWDSQALDHSNALLRAVEKFFKNSCLARVLPQQDVGHVLAADVRFRADVVEISQLLASRLGELNRPLLLNGLDQLRRRALDALEGIRAL
jgi:hypothetical protein